MNIQSSHIKKFFYDPEGTLTPEEIATLEEMGAVNLTLLETEQTSKERQLLSLPITAFGTLFNF